MSHRGRLRSLLFVPGDRPDRFSRALESGADAVILDLEDAVAPDRKPSARAEVVRRLSEPPAASAPALWVRVNSARSDEIGADLAALAGLTFAGVLLPKAMPDDVVRLPAWIAAVLPIVETAAGLLEVDALAAAPRVRALTLGAADLRAEAGLEVRADGQELLYARSRLVFASVAAGIEPPVDSVYTDIPDLEGLSADAVLGRSLGMGGKFCIHPSQVPGVNAAHTPSAEQVAWARRVLAGFEAAAAAGAGVVAVGGQMVDLPIANRARSILDRAE